MGLNAPGPADVDFRTAVGPLLGMGDWDGNQRESVRAALLNWNKEAANSSTLHWDDLDDVTSATQQTRADLSLGRGNAKYVCPSVLCATVCTNFCLRKQGL
jgi:hypothetical protein